jgi:5-methylcytosine-specific restriction endonuclease McrA
MIGIVRLIIVIFLTLLGLSILWDVIRLCVQKATGKHKNSEEAATFDGRTADTGDMPVRKASGYAGTTVSQQLHDTVIARDNFTCQVCGNDMFKTPELSLDVEFITPPAEGGKAVPNNLRTVCSGCTGGNR